MSTTRPIPMERAVVIDSTRGYGSTTPDPQAIAEELGGRQIGEGRYSIHCPVHDDGTPSAVVHDTGDGVVVHCYAGCASAELRDALRARGLWPEHRESRSRGPTPYQLRREALQHAIRGTVPERVPPYTRSIPRRSRVLILCGGDTWEARRRIGAGIILPPRHAPAAYRWPVRGRTVTVVDLVDAPERHADRDHTRTPGWVEDWRRCRECWSVERQEWLQAFARILIRRDGALQVHVASDTGRAEFRREVAARAA